MRMPRRPLAALSGLLAPLLAAALLFAPLPASAQEARAAQVVELFTSQGCANCPKANALLGSIAKEDGVIALTYAVGYWDYLGWRDTFAKPEFAARQKDYATALGQSGVYTPEVVVNGARHASGSKAKLVRAIMAQDAPLSAARIAFSAGAVELDSVKRFESADVWLIEYDPGPTYVQVKKGENAGVNMPHYNLVTKLKRLGEWRGGHARFKAACVKDCVVIVQSARGGPVIAAATPG
jgi:hypothetical protein